MCVCVTACVCFLCACMYVDVVAESGGCVHAADDGHSDMACRGNGGVIVSV